MKIKKIWSIFLFILLTTLVIGCDKNLTKGDYYNITTKQVEHAEFKVLNREESVVTAYEGQKLFVSVIFEEGYELDKVYINNKENDGVSFTMPNTHVEVTITVKEIISNINIIQSSGGTITCDKSSAKYGEKIHITVTPNIGYYVKSRGLKVNTAEVSVPPIYNSTTYEYTMPHTDINITAQFVATYLNRGLNFGDYDHKTIAHNSEKWNYLSESENNEIYIELKGTGNGNKARDVGFTYYKEKSNYFYFSTEVQITDFEISSTYENRVGIFFGDGSKMGTIGYYFKKYSSSNNMFIGRKYTSLTFDSGYRTVISGFQDVMMGNANDGTDDTLQNGNIPTSQGGKANITKTAFKTTTMKMGIIYDGINQKIHILLNDFNTNELKYVRTISGLDFKYFSVNSEGKVNFGLYAEAAHSITFKFFNMEYSNNREYIEQKFPEIIEK